MHSRKMKWIFGGMEAFLGIPLIGGLFIIGMYYTPLALMLVLHIIGLVFAVKEARAKTGHVLGIVASTIGWIPIVGMILHILTATFLMVEASKDQ